jgi:hypothetical protein
MTILLKLIYKSILTGMPILTYNAFTNMYNIPFTVKPYSTYLNFKMDPIQIDEISKYVEKFSGNLSLVPIKLSVLDKPSYFISVNIYNCTSPLFLNGNKAISRCEINTYVKDHNNKMGTLILDYGSNSLSLDPISLFKKGDTTNFLKIQENDKNSGEIECTSINPNFDFHVKYSLKSNKNFFMTKSMISYTDNIFYKNGICDKLYYDSSLVNSNTKIPFIVNDYHFNYKGMRFKNLHSVFFFDNEINFICSLWHNLFA